jgi:hypothetical protein
MDAMRREETGMTAWTQDELEQLDATDELQVASTRRDGTLRPWVTIWVVRVEEDVYVRSAHGPANPWFVFARTAGTGRIRAGGLERDVVFADADPGVHEAVDAAYRAKYGRYARGIVRTVVGPEVHDLTLRLVPTQPTAT